jgi:hypothetical protein
VPVTATAAVLPDDGHQPESAAMTARMTATTVSRIPPAAGKPLARRAAESWRRQGHH